MEHFTYTREFMIFKQLRKRGRAVLSLFAGATAVSLAFASCASTPAVLILNNSGDEASSGPFAFAGTNLLTNRDYTFTVKNTRGDSATLTGFSESGIGLGGAFRLQGGTCANGTVLVEDQSCTVVVRFQPEDEGAAQVTMTIQYFVDGDTTEVERTSKTLSGNGILDCSLRPEMVQSRAAGVIEATQRNQTEYNNGVAAGRALTYNDGSRAGSANGYRDGYTQGYNSPQGQRAGYTAGYNTGLAQGLASQSACDSGASAARNQASSDGSRQGQYDGYHDGYADGYPLGQDDGYIDGYDDGSASCGAPARDDVPGPAPASLIEACRRQGFAATYNGNSYQSGYGAAAAANAEYQRGLREGYASGLNAGIVAGTRQGYADGEVSGRSAGYSDGTQQTYQRCYTQVYTPAYTTYYNASYVASYDSGTQAGYTDGYNDTYDRGYADGQEDTCPGARAAAAPSHQPRQFGRNQFWYVSVDGRWVEQFAVGENPVGLDGSELASFRAAIESVHTNARTTLRAQAKTAFQNQSHEALRLNR
jgi:flagellar biosynthesis/type III secretory pathway protein FliH